MTMITPVELDNSIAAGDRAREADAGHGRFCAAVYHPHFLNRWRPIADQFRHLHLQGIGNSKTQTARCRLAHGVNNNCRRVTEDCWSPAYHIVVILLPIDLPKPGDLS